VQLNLYGFVMATKEGPVEVRCFHADNNVVAALAFFDANVAGTDLIALGDDVRVDLFLLGAHDAYVAIVSGNAEIGASAYLVGLGPVVGARWSRGGRCEG
jgi:hypothetical protein